MLPPDTVPDVSMRTVKDESAEDGGKSDDGDAGDADKELELIYDDEDIKGGNETATVANDDIANLEDFDDEASVAASGVSDAAQSVASASHADTRSLASKCRPDGAFRDRRSAAGAGGTR